MNLRLNRLTHLSLATRRLTSSVAFLLLALTAHAMRAPQSPEAAAIHRATTQSPDNPNPDPNPTPQPATHTSTPRQTTLAFLESARRHQWEAAARHLDLTQLSNADGPELARQLKVLLDRRLWVDLNSLSDDPAGHTDDNLDPNRDRLGTIPRDKGDVPILLERITTDDATVSWKVSGATLRRVPELYDELDLAPLTEHLPQFMQDVRFLEIALWQWIGLLVCVLLAWIAGWVGAIVGITLLRTLALRSKSDLDDRFVAAMAAPARFLLALGAFNVVLLFLRLSARADEFLREASRALVIVGIAWVVFRIVDLFAAVSRERLAASGHTAAIHLIPLGTRAVKVAIGVLTFLAALDTFGFDVTALIAGLGLGGLAVALAAQKTIENVFGGVTVLVDQPVRPGDLCRFGDKTGTVEDVGLRSTRVRTAERTVISVPNAEFANLHIENLAGRDRMLITANLRLRVETTPEEMRHVLERAREVLLQHPKIDGDTARVRLVAFGDQSVDVEVFAYAMTPDGNEFLAIREQVFLEIMEVIAESGTALRGITPPLNAGAVPVTPAAPRDGSRSADDHAPRRSAAQGASAAEHARGTNAERSRAPGDVHSERPKI